MLTVVEARVLGCLLEKERTVPDQYPLTLNALVSACNQSSSREPVMHLDEHEVETAIASLKTAGLTRLVHPSHGRSVTRYRQVADEAWSLEQPAAALVAVLLLRGPQTVAELRARTERQYVFASLDEVHQVLDELAERGLVRRLERQPGQQAPRWQQLLASEPGTPDDVGVPSSDADGAAVTSAAPPAVPNTNPIAPPDDAQDGGGLRARVDELEARVAALEAALAELL